MLKYALGNVEYIKNLQVMFEKVWNGEEIPGSWALGKIVTIFKNKGTRKEPKNYRLLTISSAVGKIFRTIIVNRLNPWYNAQLSLSQNGFRANYGTTDAILRNKTIQSLANKLNIQIYALYIDLSAAFDKVIREWVFKSIRIRIPNSGSTKLIDLLQNFYSNTTAYLNIDPNNEVFKTDIGVAQGGVEAPPLFCLYLDHVMRVYEHNLEMNKIDPVKFNYNIPEVENSTSKGDVGNNVEKWCGYADDTTIYSTSINNLQQSLQIISNIYERYKLNLNIAKTKTMIYGIKSPQTPASIIRLNSQNIENLESFRFLGSMINDRQYSTGDVEINSRVQAAECKFAEFRKILQNFDIDLQTRLKYFKVFIRSKLTYACQTWALTSKQYNYLDAAQHKLLRRMIRNGNSRINKESENFKYAVKTVNLMRICKMEELSEFIKLQQNKFISHILRSDNTNMNKRLLFNDNKRKQRGRPVTTIFTQVLKNCGLNVKDYMKKALSRKF